MTNMNSESRQKRLRLIKAPGYIAALIAEFVLSRKTYEGCFGQTLQDMRDEYYEALHQRRWWKARFKVVLFYLVDLPRLLPSSAFAYVLKIIREMMVS